MSDEDRVRGIKRRLETVKPYLKKKPADALREFQDKAAGDIEWLLNRLSVIEAELERVKAYAAENSDEYNRAWRDVETARGAANFMLEQFVLGKNADITDAVVVELRQALGAKVADADN